MTGARLDASIRADGGMDCVLDCPGADLSTRPLLCLSMIAPVDVAEGGRVVEELGSFVAIALDIQAGATKCAFRLAYQDGFRAVNRAWLPMGAYLRFPDGRTLDVETGPAGVAPSPAPEPGPPEGLGLVPAPARWTPAGGMVDFSAMALPASGDFGAGAVTRAAELAGRTGQAPLLAGTGNACRIEKDPSLAPEAYRLDIASDGLTVHAADEAGVFYAVVTLIYLRAVHGKTLPLGRIEDAPRFDWRGQHLDCARHFFRTETILRLLDLMALLKLNRFHWHFADDEAFRLEVTTAPELWQRTALRGEGQAMPGLFGGGAGPTGGSYGKKDVEAILARAKALQIEVLPEIEIPAHALCINRVIDGLRDPADSGTERSVQGYRKNVLNPALDATWDLLEPLTVEVAALFPFGHLHVGGDELPSGTWEGSPAVDALKAAEGLRDHDDVQGYTMARIAAHLRRAGITPCAWEEAARGCQGGIGHDAVLFSWTGQGPGLEAARRGHRVVMTPAQKLYFDMAHSGAAEDWGAAWAAFVSLSDTLDWDPVPDDEPELERNIIGVQGGFWAEFTCNDSEMEPMLAPRILGLATMAWSERRAVGAAKLHRDAASALPLFGAMGWNVHHAAIQCGR